MPFVACLVFFKALGISVMLTIEQMVAGLGKFLKIIRNRDGLTQKSLAEKINISVSMLQKFEALNDVNDFSMSVITKLADYLESDVHQVIKEIETLENAENQDGDSVGEIIRAGLSKEEEAIYKEHINESSETLGSHSQWALKMGALLLQLPNSSKIDIEMTILKELSKTADSDLQKKYVSRMKKLFAATLQP